MIAWILITGLALVLALPLAWRAASGRLDVFEPIVLFGLAWAAMFVARPAAMLVDGESTYWGVDIESTLPRALLLALIGAVSFVSSYELLPSRLLARRLPTPRPIDARVATAGALGISAIALVALAVFLPLEDWRRALRVLLGGRSADLGEALSNSSTYLVNASLLFVPASFVLIALAMRSRTRFQLIAASIVLGLALVRVLPAGGRITLLPLLGGLFVLAYVMRNRRPTWSVLAAAGLIALLGSYLIVPARDPTDAQTVRTAVDELRDRPQAVFDPVLRSADAEMVLALSAALTVVPDELPHRWGGATIGNFVTRPVPREAWSGKPRPPGQTIVVTLWPHLYPGFDPAFSPLLVLYWDYSLPGVAIGMALFGLLCRLLYRWFLLHRRSFVAQVIFAASIWFVVIAARNDPVDTLVLAAFLVGPIVGIVALASEGVLPALVRSLGLPGGDVNETRTP